MIIFLRVCVWGVRLNCVPTEMCPLPVVKLWRHLLFYNHLIGVIRVVNNALVSCSIYLVPLALCVITKMVFIAKKTLSGSE